MAEAGAQCGPVHWPLRAGIRCSFRTVPTRTRGCRCRLDKRSVRGQSARAVEFPLNPLASGSTILQKIRAFRAKCLQWPKYVANPQQIRNILLYLIDDVRHLIDE